MRRSSLLRCGAVIIATAATAVLVGTGVASGAPSVAGDDTATVCHATEKTVNDGLETFVQQMDKVSTQARGGDLSGAQATVKDAGATLVAIGKQLRQDAANADDAGLKATVSDLAAEFDSLGGKLTDLTGLQNFDTAKLDSLATEMSQKCGVSPGPLPTGVEPSGVEPSGVEPSGVEPSGAGPSGAAPSGSAPTSGRPTLTD